MILPGLTIHTRHAAQVSNNASNSSAHPSARPFIKERRAGPVKGSGCSGANLGPARTMVAPAAVGRQRLRPDGGGLCLVDCGPCRGSRRRGLRRSSHAGRGAPYRITAVRGSPDATMRGIEGGRIAGAGQRRADRGPQGRGGRCARAWLALVRRCRGRVQRYTSRRCPMSSTSTRRQPFWISAISR